MVAFGVWNSAMQQEYMLKNSSCLLEEETLLRVNKCFESVVGE